jgi:hypothetical protein
MRTKVDACAIEAHCSTAPVLDVHTKCVTGLRQGACAINEDFQGNVGHVRGFGHMNARFRESSWERLRI